MFCWQQNENRGNWSDNRALTVPTPFLISALVKCKQNIAALSELSRNAKREKYTKRKNAERNPESTPEGSVCWSLGCSFVLSHTHTHPHTHTHSHTHTHAHSYTPHTHHIETLSSLQTLVFPSHQGHAGSSGFFAFFWLAHPELRSGLPPGDAWRPGGLSKAINTRQSQIQIGICSCQTISRALHCLWPEQWQDRDTKIQTKIRRQDVSLKHWTNPCFSSPPELTLVADIEWRLTPLFVKTCTFWRKKCPKRHRNLSCRFVSVDPILDNPNSPRSPTESALLSLQR